MYVNRKGLKRITYMNLPNGFVLRLFCSPDFLNNFGEYLLEKYKHDPDADVQNTYLAGEIRLFSEKYKNGLIAVSENKTGGFRKITVSEFGYNEMN
jgi:hypothetical protein